MLGIDQKAARATWTAFLVALAIYLTYLARRTLIMFMVALFFAYMLSPLVDFVSRFVPRRLSRNLSLIIVYVMLVAMLVGLGFAVGSQVVEQGNKLATTLPELVKKPDSLQKLPLPQWLEPVRARILEAIRTEADELKNQAIPLIKKAFEEIAAHADGLLMIVLVPILSFFFLKDGHKIREAVVHWIARERSSTVFDEILEDIHTLLGAYIRALVILACATFVTYTLFLQFSGGQYPILLGGVAALLEFIPVVGPLAASVIILLVEAVSGGNVLPVILFLIVYRLFQDYVLAPYLMGHGVELHPLLVLFGVLAGEQIGGVPGMFFSVPVLATFRVIYVRLQRARARRELAPLET